MEKTFAILFFATFISHFGTQLQKALKQYPFGRCFDFAYGFAQHDIFSRPPKLTYLKLANKLQTVNLLHRGWRGVANKGTSSASLRLGSVPTTRLNGRSGARHQPLPYWQFLGRTPYTHQRTSAPFFKRAHKVPFRGDTIIDFSYGFARYDVF